MDRYINMEILLGTYLFIIVTIFTIELDAVTVNPALCPTNKIAPHRRTLSGSQGESRTLRLFYDLLAPHRPHLDPYNDLQEQPQEDDPNDCGEIEDYDETDLSSVTHQAPRKKDRHDRMLFGIFNRPSFSPPRPSGPAPPRPPRPQRPPPPPTRPPFWSGGIFGSNTYRPPHPQNPSNYIKPVQEDTSDTYAPYRPEVVGGAPGHVVGFTTTTGRPTRRPRPGTSPQEPFRFPNEPESYTRVPRTRPLNPATSTSIVGSFVDLLFK